MSNIAFSLDWLKCTFAWDGEIDPVYLIPMRDANYTEERGIGSYNSTLTCPSHSVSWHTERPEQKVMLSMTGLQLSEFRLHGGREETLLKECLARNGNFTRLDFAVDLFDTGGKPQDVREAWLCSQVMTCAKSVTQIEKVTREKSAGATVYIGSRQSERLIRVYEKGLQKDLKTDWLRIELEATGKRAIQLAVLARLKGTKTAGLSMLADVIEWSDIPWFNSVWEDDFDMMNIDAIGRPETDRNRWLRTVVVPVVETELETGNEWLLEALTALITQYESRSGHGPRITPTNL